MSQFKLPSLSRHLALLSLACVAGCAHQPQPRASLPAPQPVPVVSAPTPPAPAPDAAQAPVAPEQAAALAPESTGAASPANANTAPDLIARMRGGFSLPDPEAEAVDQQLRWFANNPQYLERTFGRAELWLYYIVGQLESRHMPTELALLPVVESAFEPYAYSRARAAGMWQFISDTGRHFGLKQDWWYDGRRDPIEATRAALDYLQSLHDEFGGDWLLAVAAYNCGEGAVSRAVLYNQREGLPTDFWHLRLPRETRAYVPKLLAMKRLVAEPARYGLEFSHIPNSPYFVEVATGGQIVLKVVADLAGVSTDDLYQLNPAFHRWATDPTGPHRLLVPLEVAPGLQDALNQLTPDQRMRVEHYVVASGDTVASIADHYGTRPDVIRELNEMGPAEAVVIGASLRVPSTHIQLPAQATRAAMLVDAPLYRHPRFTRRPGIRVVRRGDTLYQLAHRLHTDVGTLARLNGINPSAHLRPGQRLRVVASVQGGHYSRHHGRHNYYSRRHSHHGSRVARYNGASRHYSRQGG